LLLEVEVHAGFDRRKHARAELTKVLTRFTLGPGPVPVDVVEDEPGVLEQLGDDAADEQADAGLVERVGALPEVGVHGPAGVLVVQGLEVDAMGLHAGDEQLEHLLRQGVHGVIRTRAGVLGQHHDREVLGTAGHQSPFDWSNSPTCWKPTL
jgi:hypothetical protein